MNYIDPYEIKEFTDWLKANGLYNVWDNDERQDGMYQVWEKMRIKPDII